jgi:CheY-like chemotaxis protein
MIHHDQHDAPTILIIENDPSNRFLAERILSLYGYRYLSAANGKEALDLLDSTEVDCIITDLSMPVLDGLSVTSALRQRPEYAAIPIVALTAHAFGPQRQEALRVGCTDVIVKPYHPKQLVETIARYLNSSHP